MKIIPRAAERKVNGAGFEGKSNGGTVDKNNGAGFHISRENKSYCGRDASMKGQRKRLSDGVLARGAWREMVGNKGMKSGKERKAKRCMERDGGQ
ncbi:hypothetical protein PoB_006609100 [Plakobranchus ocellatus]|uniref:Uncharacterized protein n=1 Tax=Plakobranchus ocellatus TaxID=259542 RepID=A0AAV4D6L1_9GAST|nr:hypothetical protein PoB_006609100 [Plakobranchus ocellatus]